MAHHDRKIRKKFRGSRTCGYGNTQKHRGGGSKGGRGLGGSKKQKWSYISKYQHGYFGRDGFKRPQKVVKKEKTINIQDIEKNFDKFLKEGKIKKEGSMYRINLKEMGYGKLLGKGKSKFSKQITIIVDKCSEKALKKIESVGGKIELGISKTIN